ncbi:MAG: hypothetical protein ACPGOY_12435 [Rhodospirillaceae bacterium]
MPLDRIQTDLTKPLSDHVERMVGPHGQYPTASDYLQDLIKRDMERDDYDVYKKIKRGYEDMTAGRIIKSSGNWKEDQALFQKRKEDGWT